MGERGVKRNLGPTRKLGGYIGYTTHVLAIFGGLLAYAIYDNMPSSKNHLQYVTTFEVDRRNLFPVPKQYDAWYAQRVCGYFHPEKEQLCKDYLKNHYDHFYSHLRQNYLDGLYLKHAYRPTPTKPQIELYAKDLEQKKHHSTHYIPSDNV